MKDSQHKRLEPSEKDVGIPDYSGPLLKKMKITTPGVSKDKNRSPNQVSPNQEMPQSGNKIEIHRNQDNSPHQQNEDFKEKDMKNSNTKTDSDEDIKHFKKKVFGTKAKIKRSEDEESSYRSHERDEIPGKAIHSGPEEEEEEKKDQQSQESLNVAGLEETWDVISEVKSKVDSLKPSTIQSWVRNIKQVGAESLRFVAHPRGYSSASVRHCYRRILTEVLCTGEEIFPIFKKNSLIIDYGDCCGAFKELESKDNLKDLQHTMVIHKKKNKKNIPIFVLKIRINSREKEQKILETYFDALQKTSKSDIASGVLVNEQRAVFMKKNRINNEEKLIYSQEMTASLDEFIDGRDPSKNLEQFFKIIAAILACKLEID